MMAVEVERGGYPLAGDMLVMPLPYGPAPAGWTLVDAEPEKRGIWRYAMPGDMRRRDVTVVRGFRPPLPDEESTSVDPPDRPRLRD